jgi:hypothetical protein
MYNFLGVLMLVFTYFLIEILNRWLSIVLAAFIFLWLSGCTTTKQSSIDQTSIRCATIAQDVEPLYLDESESIDTQCVRVREHAEGVLVKYNQILKCVRSEK